MCKNNYCVYVHTNKTNGKVYVGLTGMKPEDRWRNGNGYHNKTYFKNAIDKYGWDNFTHEIIKDNLTKEDAANWEIYYISFYKSSDRRYGYNMSSGGENGGGHPQSEETRRKIGENGYHYGMLGKKLSDETKQKISESNMGRTFSDETRKKLSESALKNRGRLFLCVELNRVFDNLTDAHDVTTCPKGAIVLCCQGKQKQSKGYHWKYVD